MVEEQTDIETLISFLFWDFLLSEYIYVVQFVVFQYHYYVHKQLYSSSLVWRRNSMQPASSTQNTQQFIFFWPRLHLYLLGLLALLRLAWQEMKYRQQKNNNLYQKFGLRYRICRCYSVSRKESMVRSKVSLGLHLHTLF